MGVFLQNEALAYCVQKLLKNIEEDPKKLIDQVHDTLISIADEILKMLVPNVPKLGKFFIEIINEKLSKRADETRFIVLKLTKAVKGYQYLADESSLIGKFKNEIKENEEKISFF